jgi:hypothetical protein
MSNGTYQLVLALRPDHLTDLILGGGLDQELLVLPVGGSHGEEHFLLVLGDALVVEEVVDVAIQEHVPELHHLLTAHLTLPIPPILLLFLTLRLLLLLLNSLLLDLLGLF